MSQQQRKLRDYLKRRATAPARAKRYACAGGPFDNYPIWMTCYETARFRVGHDRGYYRTRGGMADWIPATV